MRNFCRNVVGDLPAVKSSIFNEDFIGMHAGNDHAGQVNTWCFTLQGGWIGARALGGGIERNSN